MLPNLADLLVFPKSQFTDSDDPGLLFLEGVNPGSDSLPCDTFRDTNAATMNATPKFSEMQKVRTCVSVYGSQMEGFVIANKFHEGRWIYKISLPNPDEKDATYDNWVAEEHLEIAL